MENERQELATTLDSELEKYGFTLKTFEDFVGEIVDSLVAAVEQVVETVKEVWFKIFKIISKAGFTLLDAVLWAVNDNPKYWHYYKHAKKLRTRKKYRNKLLRNATAVIEKGALI